MNKYLLAVTLLLLISANSFAQIREVKEIKITSAVGWTGEEHYSELLIKNVNGIYLLNENKIEKKLIDNLLIAVSEPAVKTPRLENLGVTQKWLSENANQDLNGYLIERLDDAMPIQRKLFKDSFKDTKVVEKTLDGLFYISASDYYPRISIEIIEKNGSKMKIFSESQTLLSLPWEITLDGRKVETFNAHISHALSNIMPEKSANKKRLIGENLRGELAKAVMDEIEDEWDLLKTEEQVSEDLKELRKSFVIKTARIYKFDGDKGDFYATLRRDDLPRNFSILLELPYENGKVQNIYTFIQKIEQYKNLIFSVNWLKNYMLAHPEEEFRLNFDMDSSFGSSLEQEFYEQLNLPGKQKLVDEVKKNQEQISAIQVGGKYFYSQWLILPNKKMILFRYNYFNSLMRWKVKDFSSFDCDNRKCVGATISPNGKIISK